jgi:8-oxo-dGTP pyrophosphatase MutT (NUDIX family)
MEEVAFRAEYRARPHAPAAILAGPIDPTGKGVTTTGSRPEAGQHSMSTQPTRNLPVVVAGIIQRYDDRVLICRKNADDDRRRWVFPGGMMGEDRSPEAALRRLVLERVGLRIEIVVGQPPLLGQYEGRNVEYRFFTCGLADGEASPIGYAEVRWVVKSRLCEYEFDPPTDHVIRWFTE